MVILRPTQKLRAHRPIVEVSAHSDTSGLKTLAGLEAWLEQTVTDER